MVSWIFGVTNVSRSSGVLDVTRLSRSPVERDVPFKRIHHNYDNNVFELPANKHNTKVNEVNVAKHISDRAFAICYCLTNFILPCQTTVSVSKI